MFKLTSHFMTRRRFMQATGLAALFWGMGNTSQSMALSDKRNILFIAIDDLNDWVGCLGGHSDVKTPNLDRLAQRGVLFTNAHCAAPACNPSRAALMTGIRPSTSGIYSNHQPWRTSPVLKEAKTLPQHFMDHGYLAMGSGKIYHGRFPDPHSWQHYWPSQQKNKPDDPMPENLPLNGIPNTRHFDWGPVPVNREEMGDWKVAEWVSGQLKKKHDRPFFLACGFYRPHLPWFVPQEYFDLYPLEDISLPQVKENDHDDIPAAGVEMARTKDHENVTTHHQWRRAVQAYLASISFVDECVGRVIDAWDASAYNDNTVLVLWSDHGWHLGEKLHWRKFSLWEEATHNVLMFVAPGVTKAGGRCDAPVSLMDIYPTLSQLAGCPVPAVLEGNSLIPLLKNPDIDWDEPALTTHKYNNHSVRSREWRYTRYADGSEELYHHPSDPMEWNNLAAKPKVETIKERLGLALPKTNAEPI